MGMFDYLYCEFLLPLAQYNVLLPSLTFQTKDLGSCMDEYKIDRRGLLLKNVAPRDLTNPEEVWEMEDFTGTVEFYTSIKSTLKLPHSWIAFKAEFLHGLLLGPITISPEIRLADGVTSDQVIQLPSPPDIPLKDINAVMDNLQETINAAEEALIYVRANNIESATLCATSAHSLLVLARKGIHHLRLDNIKEEDKVPLPYEHNKGTA